MEPSATATPMPDEKWALYSAAVTGPRHDYYLAQFKRIDAGKWPLLSWNWGAMLFTFNWLRYRKMYAYSWAYLFVSTPVIFLILLVSVSGDRCAAELQGATTGFETIVLVLLLANLLPPLFANRLYFHFLTKRIAVAARGTADKNALWQLLFNSPSTGGYWGSTLGMIGFFVVGGIAVPSYGSYTTRAKFSELILAGASYRTRLAEYFDQHKRLPSKLEDIGGFSGPSGPVKAITMEKDGTIRVVAGFTPAEGRSIRFRPSVRDGEISWVCRSDDVPAKCLPASCRP